ncbi:hypothetical protein EON67_05835, partial [archaeon]
MQVAANDAYTLYDIEKYRAQVCGVWFCKPAAHTRRVCPPPPPPHATPARHALAALVTAPMLSPFRHASPAWLHLPFLAERDAADSAAGLPAAGATATAPRVTPATEHAHASRMSEVASSAPHSMGVMHVAARGRAATDERGEGAGSAGTPIGADGSAASHTDSDAADPSAPMGVPALPAPSPRSSVAARPRAA